MAREIEHKFRVHEDFRVPELTAAAGSVELFETVHLEAAYYDTPDLRLAREGITLRERRGGTDAGWHLKIPVWQASPEVRDEIRLPPGRGDTPPDELVALWPKVSRRRLRRWFDS